MKILACTDGSEQSKRALEEASKIAAGCGADEVAIIYVYEHMQAFIYGSSVDREIKRLSDLEEQYKEEGKKIVSEALKIFEKKNIKARTIVEQGHPSEVIIKVASEGGFDLIVIGSRGRGGLKKLLLGSVSSAVVHEANTDVLTVK